MKKIWPFLILLLFVVLFAGAGVYAYSVGKFELVIFATLVALGSFILRKFFNRK